MRRVALLLPALSACVDEACLWERVDVRREATAIARIDATPVAVSAPILHASTTRSTRDDSPTTRFDLTVTLPGDPMVDWVGIEGSIVDRGPAVLEEARLANDRMIIDRVAPSGAMVLDSFAIACEQSDSYQDAGPSWACAANLDATLDVTFASQGRTYAVTATLAVRQDLMRECHECGGIEGCSY